MKYSILAGIVLALATVGCMSTPAGLHVYESKVGCTSDGECPWEDGAKHNFYLARLHEIVIVPGQPFKVIAHEACHAHQQQEVIDETGHDVSRTLVEWLDTDEAFSYNAVVIAAGPAPWGDSGIRVLEDFAEACGRYLANDDRWPQEPQRAAWFAARGFK
jgi:hypothetical protein